MANAPEIAAALDLLADAIASKVLERLAGDASMVDQDGSPLGRRRHIAAVRKHVASAAGGAAIVGRRHLLSRDLLAAELAAQSTRGKQAHKPNPVSDLLDRYGLEPSKGAA